MTGLCRVCDCPLKVNDMRLMEVVQGVPYFFVKCSSCNMEYYAQANGDVVTKIQEVPDGVH